LFKDVVVPEISRLKEEADTEKAHRKALEKKYIALNSENKKIKNDNKKLE